MPANFNVQARVPVVPGRLPRPCCWFLRGVGHHVFRHQHRPADHAPLLMNAVRFLCAGVVMLLIALWQGPCPATALQWRNSALVGRLMVFWR